MKPAASVSGYYFWHPEARYFGVGRIGRDQVADYAGARASDVETMARWLAPNLDDEPVLVEATVARGRLNRYGLPSVPRNDAWSAPESSRSSSSSPVIR